jgi:Xaa-Pro aminopeptidase
MRDDKPIELEPGIVLTVEPGIYIPSDADDVPDHFRGIGVRIEDDVLVIEGGNDVITSGVPVERAAIEAIMGGE